MLGYKDSGMRKTTCIMESMPQSTPKTGGKYSYQKKKKSCQSKSEALIPNESDTQSTP